MYLYKVIIDNANIQSWLPMVTHMLGIPQSFDGQNKKDITQIAPEQIYDSFLSKRVMIHNKFNVFDL